MKTQFKDIVSYGLSTVAGVLTGAVAGPAAGAGVALAGAYKKELLALLQTKGPQVLIGLLKSKGKLDVVKILSANFLHKHALPFYAAPKVAEGYTDDDIETTKQFRNAIAGLKAKSAIDKAKDGAGAKYYSDGAKVTPQETARRAAERKAQKDKKGVAEAKADPTGTWVVYDGSKITKFKTHNGAKAYAEKNGGTVASSEYYYDKIQKQDIAEEQQTQAKTWDQMTPQEKSSGVKGRTVWNEKTQRYYTVFDVPTKQETDEGWLKNTAAGLALGAAAIGGAQAGTSMDDPSWHSGQYASHVKSDQTIQKQTGSPSVNQKRISDVTGPNAAGEYRITVTQNGKIASQYITKTPPPDWMMKEQDLDEASLATMRDYFAGDENARDPMDITKQRLHFSKDKNARPTVDKRFRSPAEYQAWLKQNKLQQISGANESTNNKGWLLTNKRKQ